MRVITLRPGEAPKFNDIPALLDTTEAVQHFCGGDISPDDMPRACMLPEMDLLLRGPVVFCRRCGHELAAVYEDDLKAVKKSIVLPGGDWF